VKRLAVAASVVLLLAGAPRATPAEPFAPRDGQFRVKFHGTPKEKTTTATSALGKLKVFTATYASDDDNAFLVSYTDFPEGTAKPETRATLLDGVRDGLKGKDGTVLKDEEVEFGSEKLAGRELELTKGDRRVRVTAVLRNDRLFQVGVVGTKEFVASKAATDFLKSFEITK
jgi:hypothetical protein